MVKKSPEERRHDVLLHYSVKPITMESSGPLKRKSPVTLADLFVDYTNHFISLASLFPSLPVSSCLFSELHLGQLPLSLLSKSLSFLLLGHSVTIFVAHPHFKSKLVIDERRWSCLLCFMFEDSFCVLTSHPLCSLSKMFFKSQTAALRRCPNSFCAFQLHWC